MPQVQVIQPIQQQPKRLRVAAYARVSSDSTDQLNSLSVQVDYYTHLIQENPNWDFAGIYADEGITGTSTKHREQFNRLLDDCRAGLIDRVLVKSASRFARNTADALASVREMKSLGVTVVFEKEGFDTETANGEMILSMICATAQEESLSISQNTKWGIRKKMHDGTYITSLTPFGYKKINRQLFPDEKEAATVKEIFNLFLNGFSTAEIANHLNTNHPKPDVIWRSASVRFILRNEKYIGDSLFQKNYTPDTLPLKSCCNTGQLPKYYVEGTHPGIISKDEFERVQSLLTQKNKIKLVRRHRGLTQQQLGILIDIKNGAANRIAQYETGYRTPKAEIVEKIAKVLNVREETFYMPNDTIVDLIRMLIWYDWEHSLPFQDFGDSTQCFLLRIRLSCSHPAVKALLADWQIHRTAFENGRITSSDYLEWMLQWPPTLSAPDD